MDRRRFIERGGLAVAAGAFPSIWIPRRPTERTILRSGLVYDGSGQPPFEADLLLESGRIIEIGTNLSSADAEVVDISGKAVAPGFIDIHSHTDLSLLINPQAESKVRQGVTTEVAGQDGSSILWDDGTFESIRDRYAGRYDATIDFRSLAGFFDHLERSPGSVNVASMVGAGSVREVVMGWEQREPSSTTSSG